MAQTRTDAAAQQKVWDMVRDIEVAMMVTMDEEGRFRGRPMRASQKEFDGVLWFFTEAASPNRVPLASATPCSAPRHVETASTGPKISSWATRAAGSTRSSTVGSV